MRTLHITNGTAVMDKMREAGIAGRIVPWNDVLHEGPVPAGLNVAALRAVRAEFIASDSGSFDDVARSFAERDAALEELRGIDEVVLWFEHDLYDQLQLIQILDMLPTDRGPLVTAVPGDDYLLPGLKPGSATEVRGFYHGLFEARREITSAQRVAAHDAWMAFRSDDPRAIVEVLPRATALPHLAPALWRHLQQFPALTNGLSRTEQQALEAVASGLTRVKDIYTYANHKREDAVFMGDLAFAFHIRAVICSSRPLLVRSRVQPPERGGRDRARGLLTADELLFNDDVSLTEDGARVLEGALDRVAICGIDRWLGGVHLTGHGPLWRWDATRGTVRIA